MKDCVTLDVDLGSSWLPGPGEGPLDPQGKTVLCRKLAVSFWAVPLVALAGSVLGSGGV